MTRVTIKEFRNNYNDEVTNLILSIQQDEFSIPITLDQQPDLLNIPAFYQTGRGNFWIAKSGDQVVGTIALLDIGNGQGALRKMFVAKEFRGKEIGVAHMLLNTLLNWSEEKGLKEIFLGTTEKFMAAHKFYEKNGFTEIRKEELPTAFPVMDVDVKFYFLKVSPRSLASLRLGG